MSIPMVQNVVANNLNHSNFFFLKNVKIDFKNKHHMLFFPKNVITARKTKLLILYSSLVNIE
jgi:hypothetical protein